MILFITMAPLAILIYLGCMVITAFFFEACGVKGWITTVFMLFASFALLTHAITDTVQPNRQAPYGYIFIAPEPGDKLNVPNN